VMHYCSLHLVNCCPTVQSYDWHPDSRDPDHAPFTGGSSSVV